MEDPFSDLADRYNSTGNILRQVVRHELTGRGLSEHLPEPPARIVDVGGGAGQQAMPLSRKGHEVTILDPSPKMLAEARRRLRWKMRAFAGERGSSRVSGSGHARRWMGRRSTGALPRRSYVSVEDLPEVLELEWEAGRRDPYRSVARLIHLVGRKKPVQGRSRRTDHHPGSSEKPWN